MKRILVPCDFSSSALHAFRSAISFSKMEDVEIHLIHVIEIPVLHDPVLMPVLAFQDGLFKELEARAQQEFRRLTANVDARTKTIVSFGATSRMIFDYIKSNSFDLVIMGTRGATGLREMFIGSNTEKIVRHSPVPVLALRKAIDSKSIKQIVFPNAMHTFNQEGLVLQVKALQHFFGATLNLVWINTPTNFCSDAKSRKRLNEFAERYMLTNFTVNIYNDFYEESGIVKFAELVGADLIAMGTHGRTGLAHLLGGSLTEDIVNHVDMPIWTCNLNMNDHPILLNQL